MEDQIIIYLALLVKPTPTIVCLEFFHIQDFAANNNKIQKGELVKLKLLNC